MSDKKMHRVDAPCGDDPGGTPLVSVIVPVYRVEAYLDQCVESIAHQSYANLDIILVDDGSPDSCPAMCDSWARTDARIRVVHKENAGLGYARNSGLDKAVGEYVCFVDSDDYLEYDAIRSLVSIALRDRSDIVLYGFQARDPAGAVVEVYVPTPPKRHFRGPEVVSSVLANVLSRDGEEGDWHLNWSAWSVFCRMEPITRSHWRFVSERDIISEDIYSLISLYGTVSSVSMCCEALYNYRQNPFSLSTAFRRDRLDQIDRFYAESVKLVRRRGYSERIVKCLGYPYQVHVIAAIKQLVNSRESLSAKYAMIRKFSHSPVLRCATEGMARGISVKRYVFMELLRHHMVLAVMILGIAQSRLR